MPISSIFELGKRSLLTYQSAIHTTSGNISNVNNENYARRRTNLRDLTSGLNGVGYTAEKSQRMRQVFAERQLHREYQSLGKYETNEMLLSHLENIYAEDTESGLSSALNEFWQSWNELSKEPESQFARNIVKDKAVALSNTFTRINSELERLRETLVPEIKERVNLINDKLNQLNQVNHQIRTGGLHEMLDERDRLTMELSQMINIEINEKSNGEISVFSEGIVLVSDSIVNEIEAEFTSANGKQRVAVKVANLNKELRVSGGELNGPVDAFNIYIDEHNKNIDQLAASIAKSVNDVHLIGENLSGTTGVHFFDHTVTGAADFRVSNAVLNDSSLIATRAAGEGEGSGSVAQKIFNVQFAKIINNNAAGDYYHNILSSLGSSVSELKTLSESQELVVNHIKNQRDAVVAVSLDEEMTRLIQYEQSYTAASKIINTVDEMMQTILDMR
jgi:flagellar hook-associated protein 1 FlgK